MTLFHTPKSASLAVGSEECNDVIARRREFGCETFSFLCNYRLFVHFGPCITHTSYIVVRRIPAIAC